MTFQVLRHLNNRSSIATTVALILVALSTVACGGEAFTSADLDAAGGEGPAAAAGAPDAAGSPAAGSAGSSRGGSPSVGGSSVGTAGKATGGVATAGTATGGTGGAPVTCDLDVEKLTAALPKSFVWQDFTYTNGPDCMTCRDSPCGTTKVISWGAPQILDDGRLQYLPNTTTPAVPMNVGANDGACTKRSEFNLAVGTPAVILTLVAVDNGWAVNAADVQSSAASAPASDDLGKEMEASLRGLQIPCK